MLLLEVWNVIKRVELFTDGACKGNPGPGGWGAIIRYDGHEKQLYGAEAHTTNNRMELMAVIMGLSKIKYKCEVIITTDSNYVCQGITTWLKKWKLNGWKTAGNKPVKNQDLWLELDKECARHLISWHWVKGHNGHPENELADLLANKAIAEFLNGESA